MMMQVVGFLLFLLLFLFFVECIYFVNNATTGKGALIREAG
jgi:cbb3-type cytochrome oxidase subunit 3